MEETWEETRRNPVWESKNGVDDSSENHLRPSGPRVGKSGEECDSGLSGRIPIYTRRVKG